MAALSLTNWYRWLWDNLSFGRCNGRCTSTGLGEVFKSISAWFAAEKIKRNFKCMTFEKKILLRKVYPLKTCKSTTFSKRFKGWKGKR